MLSSSRPLRKPLSIMIPEPAQEVVHHPMELELYSIIRAKGLDLGVRTEEAKDCIQRIVKVNAETKASPMVRALPCINACDLKGDSALIMASHRGYAEVVKALVDVHADVNVQATDGTTALFAALDQNHQECVSILLEAKADVCQVSEDGWSPLMTAYQEKCLVAEILERTLATKNPKIINQQNKDGFNILMQMANEAPGHEDIALVTRLIQAPGIKLDLQENKQEQTALILAVIKGQERVAKILIDAKADLNKQDIYGRTALVYAASLGYYNIVISLLQAGASGAPLDVNVQAADGVTALLGAIHSNHDECISALLEAKADVCLVTENGWSPLMCSYEKGCQVEEILEHTLATRNPDIINQRSDTGWNILMLMANKPLGDVDVVLFMRLIQTPGIDINLQSFDYKGTALIFAANQGNAELVKVLLEAKADLNKQNIDGNTALMCAAMLGRDGIVKLLLDAGANYYIQNDQGETALDVANDLEYSNVVACIVEHIESQRKRQLAGELEVAFASLYCDKSYEEHKGMTADVPMLGESEDKSVGDHKFAGGKREREGRGSPLLDLSLLRHKIPTLVKNELGYSKGPLDESEVKKLGVSRPVLPMKGFSLLDSNKRGHAHSSPKKVKLNKRRNNSTTNAEEVGHFKKPQLRRMQSVPK